MSAIDLQAAIAEVLRVTRVDDECGMGSEWKGADFADCPEDVCQIDHAIATILNSVVSGDLIRADMAAAQDVSNAAAGARLDAPYAALSQHLHGDGDSAWRTRALVAEAEIERLRDALLGATAALAAAISLLDRGGKAAKKAAPSDKMFDQMLVDYRKHLETARAALKKLDRYSTCVTHDFGDNA